ncbi:hypothetical protein FF38_11014 [Lucilia cuprina]|uniref:Trichohyalin-plectin-homology domain-containing protein n=1 Tax=Lucilia cuprina TaxID=7375 RepID=A0A0L0C3P7_LUCCU|nr:hypothetical protein CVS40_9531 [Lucilia cuprina]KNC26104.1 hypothetical protein FF38_11014 [Lucilia cuprina]
MSSADLKKLDNKNEGKSKNGDEVKPGTITRAPKPIVLSSQRFNKIINNATTTDHSKALAEAEEIQKYKEQLKAGNDELVAQFKGNMQRTQEQKLQQIKEQMDKKTKQGIADYEQAKENEAQKRKEKIAKAQQIMERLKPGPRELHSAVLQSEVLRARNVQRSINEEFEKVAAKQERETKKMCNEQALSWIGEEQQRLSERQKNTIAYKKELLQTINENQKQRYEQKKQMIKEQQAAREATDLEIKAQIEKEKAIMEKKKEALRKNALEAMKMVEQRRLRDRMVEEVEDRLCCVYNTGKSQLDALRAEQTKKLANEQQLKIEAEVKKLNNIEDKSKALESERVRRDITTMQLKFTAEEQEKVRKDKAAKQARIEAYLKEMEQQKEAQRKLDEEKRFEMAQRFKNTEVNCIFNEKQRAEKLRQFQDVRSQLNKQIEENKTQKLAEKQAAISCSDNSVEKEHKFFLEYARNLMEDAQQKGRPLYPFVKVVHQYKRDNQIDCDRKVAKHLQSNVPIGEKHLNTQLTSEKTDEDRQDSTRESILQNCLKINEIIKADSSQQENKTATEIDITPKDDCALHLHLRYSMDELKKMNQFSAPTCH